jgi:hypothetical protein
MASNINSTDIDAEYPVAGVDNDSQGFRDNFSTIKNSLATAKSEITALQATTAQGVSYNSETNTNDFNGNIIQEADFIATTETVNPKENITGNQEISFIEGHYQIVQVGTNVQLTVSNWPDDGKMGRMRLQVTADLEDGEDPLTITWAAQGGGQFKSQGDWPTPFEVGPGETWIVDFWSINGGDVVFRQSHGNFS